MGGGGSPIDPRVKRHKIFVNNELNRQLLVAQLSGLGGGTILSGSERGRKPASAVTGTPLIRQDRAGPGRL